MSQGYNTMDALRKGAITGAISSAAAALVFGEAGSTRLFGMSMPTVAAIGVSNGIASVGADLAHSYVLPMIPGNAKFANVESAALGIGISGGATAFLLNRENVGSERGLNAFLLGAGSYIAGDYVDDKFFQHNGSGAFSSYY